MTTPTERSERARKAARTKKRRSAAMKAAQTKKRRSAARKAVKTKRRKMAARKAVATKKIEHLFHELIRRRAAEFSLNLPEKLPRLAGLGRERAWFPMPGMYGGFAYCWSSGAASPTLEVGSWSRVVDGSEQDHAIDEERIVLVRDGADDGPHFEIIRPARADDEPTERDPPACPKCNSTEVLRQFYGMPGPGEPEPARPGWRWTGGCIGPVPEFYCSACRAEFGELR